MTKTKWCVIQKTKTKSEFAVKINTGSTTHASYLEKHAAKWHN